MNQIILVKTSGIHMRNNPINGMKKKTLLTRSDWCEGHFENNGCQIHETTPTQQFFDYWQKKKKKNCRHNFSNYVGMQSSCKISAFFANLWNFRNLLSGTIMLLLTQPLYHCRFHLSGRWFTKMTLSGLWIQRNREYFFMKKIFVRFYSRHEILY